MKLEPVYLYPDGNTPVEQEGVKCIKKINNGRDVKFSGVMPILPLKEVGQAWHTGWDIPTVWAIDAEDNCFYDNAHGHSLQKGSKKGFIGLFENEEIKRKYQEKLGMKVSKPLWMIEAERNGWRPLNGKVKVRPFTVNFGGNEVELSDGKISSVKLLVEFQLPYRSQTLLELDSDDVLEYIGDDEAG